eukprot:6030562-Prymnesium_polylepis.1
MSCAHTNRQKGCNLSELAAVDRPPVTVPVRGVCSPAKGDGGGVAAADARRCALCRVAAVADQAARGEDGAQLRERDGLALAMEAVEAAPLPTPSWTWRYATPSAERPTAYRRNAASLSAAPMPLKPRVGRKLHADARCGHLAAHAQHNLLEEGEAAVSVAAVLIVARVRAGLQERVDQVARRRVDLDTVEAGLRRERGRLAEVLHDALDLLGRQRAGELVRIPGAVGAHHAARGHVARLDRQRRRTHDLRSSEEGRVRHATSVPELRNDGAALGVYGIGELGPRGGVLGRVHAGRVAEAVRPVRHRGWLSDD